jgi:hypothetical protein
MFPPEVSMRDVKIVPLAIVMAAVMGGLCSAATPPGPDVTVVAGAWQHHTVKVSYFGITSLYTCSGLEDHVRDILLHFGARKDAKVRASGCARGPDSPSPTAWIDADFYTLAPATDSAAPDTVKAYWTQREMGPKRPSFMDDGDCELVDQMKDTISKSFALKDLKYQTDCFPHQIMINGFHVKADALIAVPEAKPLDNKRS